MDSLYLKKVSLPFKHNVSPLCLERVRVYSSSVCGQERGVCECMLVSVAISVYAGEGGCLGGPYV